MNRQGRRVRAGCPARVRFRPVTDLSRCRFRRSLRAAAMSPPGARGLSTGFLTARRRGTGAESREESSALSFFLRRNSSGSSRELMCCVGYERGARRHSLRSIVVTPDSIPQFTIPKLAVTEDGETPTGGHTEHLSHHLHLSSPSVSISSSSSPSLCSSSPALGRKAQRSISDPSDNHRRTSVRRIPESDQCADPATRGALSLPHLAKITTPYGFISLSQSPQMANEEELFLQKGYRTYTRNEKNMPLRNLGVEMKSNSSGGTLPVQSHTTADSHPVSRGINSSETSVCSGSFPSPTPAGRPKQNFWGLLRKHLSNRKLTKSI